MVANQKEGRGHHVPSHDPGKRKNIATRLGKRKTTQYQFAG
jgi:hypothetical protein